MMLDGYRKIGRVLQPRYGKRISHCLAATSPRIRHFIQPANLDPDDEWHPRDAGNSGLYLKRYFKHRGHKYWGFRIFRCAYGDDKAWSHFMAALHRNVREGLEYCGTEEMIESFDCSVHEDPSILDGASKEVVRQRFREWTRGPEAEAERLTPQSCPIHVGGYASTARYAYCIHVDEEALRSVVASNEYGHVNIIKAEWPHAEEIEDLRRENVFDDPLDEGYEDVEGCKLRDVGWMKVEFAGLLPDTYATLEDGDWDGYYWRPPTLAFRL